MKHINDEFRNGVESYFFAHPEFKTTVDYLEGGMYYIFSQK